MKKPEEASADQLTEDVRRILETSFWIPDFKGGDTLMRLHDDADGKLEGILIVSFPGESDIIVTTDGHRGSALRFRSAFGGGKSQRVRNALMILALAMKLDNEENPQF